MLGFMRAKLTAGDSQRRDAPFVDEPAPDTASGTRYLEWKPANEHAEALLRWLQGPRGRIGTISAADLQGIYGDVITALEWEPAPWQNVSSSFRKLIGRPKEYAQIKRVRTCVYRVPKAASGKAPLKAIAA